MEVEWTTYLACKYTSKKGLQKSVTLPTNERGRAGLTISYVHCFLVEKKNSLLLYLRLRFYSSRFDQTLIFCFITYRYRRHRNHLLDAFLYRKVQRGLVSESRRCIKNMGEKWVRQSWSGLIWQDEALNGRIKAGGGHGTSPQQPGAEWLQQIPPPPPPCLCLPHSLSLSSRRIFKCRLYYITLDYNPPLLYTSLSLSLGCPV
jgi:hypothetical protein